MKIDRPSIRERQRTNKRVGANSERPNRGDTERVVADIELLARQRAARQIAAADSERVAIVASRQQ
jgi:hypothetical protein